MARGPSKRPRRTVLQPRDLDLLTAVGHAGTLDTSQLRRFFFVRDASGQACRRRLSLLTQAGYLRRSFIEVTSADGRGRAPVLYNLTPTGARLVEQERGVCGLRTAQGDRLTPLTLRHRAMIGELVLTFDAGCRGAGLDDPQWILEYDVAADAPAGKGVNRFALRHALQDANGKKQICWPDAACQLETRNANATARLVLLFEIDRSTEDHPQLGDKLTAYELLFRNQSFRRHWPGAEAALLFFVVLTKKRLANVASLFAKSNLAQQIRLTTLDDLRGQSPIFDPIWRTTRLECRALLAKKAAYETTSFPSS